MSEFGECPECGKMTLILVKKRGLVFEYLNAKCVDPDCDFEEEVDSEWIEKKDEE